MNLKNYNIKFNENGRFGDESEERVRLTVLQRSLES